MKWMTNPNDNANGKRKRDKEEAERKLALIVKDLIDSVDAQQHSQNFSSLKEKGNNCTFPENML